MNSKSVGKSDRSIIGVECPHIVAGLLVLKFLRDELFDELLLFNQLFFNLRWLSAQSFFKAGFIVTQIDQNHRAQTMILSARLQHQINFPLGPAAILGTVRPEDMIANGRSEP